MKTTGKLLLSTALIAAVLCIAGCDDDEPRLTGDEVVYQLSSVSNPAISGSATFARRDDGKTVITIELDGTTGGTSHPAHIHSDNAAKGGSILIDLTSVNGSTGKSTTVVSQMNDGTVVSYDDLIEIDGYINVHMSETDLSTLVAQGDVGQNALTGDKEEYTLGSVSNPSISGTATFEKRINGETKVTVQLNGTTAGGDHPSHIHANSAAQGGGIMIDLTNINGTTGRSVTNVSQLNAGTAITYDELIVYNGYLNVHLSPTSLSTLIAQGDIGSNELTGDSKVYTLNSMSNPAISGTVTFAKRKNGFALVTVSLAGTTAGGNHPSHIHANNAATGGPIVKDFTNINGTTGKSVTHVAALNNGTAITYDQLLTYNGYVNVHLSPTQLSTLIAQGNIGSNAP